MTALLLTQVRSLALAAAASVGVFALLRLRQGRAVAGAASLAFGAALVAGAYVWAVAVGGDSLAGAFLWPAGRRRRQHVSGGAGRVPDLHAVGAAVRVSLRRRHRPLGDDARLLRRQLHVGGAADPRRDPADRLAARRRHSAVDRRWARRWSAGLRASYLVAVRADGSLQESGTAILCLQLTLLAICMTRPRVQHAAGYPVLGADRRAVGARAGRRCASWRPRDRAAYA